MQATWIRAVALTSAFPLAAQALPTVTPSTEALLPASTYAAIRFGGLAACREATSAWPMAAVVQTFLQQVPGEVRAEHLDKEFDQAAVQVQKALQRAGLNPADVKQVLGQPMTLAFGRLSIEGMGPSVALLIETGDKKPAINRVVQCASHHLARLADGGETGQVDIGGQPFHVLNLNEGPPLFAGQVGKWYVASNSRGFVRELLDVASGKAQSLGKSSRVVQLQGQLPAPALVSLFVHAERMFSGIAPHLPYEAEEWSQALGLGHVDAVYAATTANAQGGADVLHFGVGGSERGLMKALVAAPVDLSFAKSCSANTVVFGSGSFDVPAVVDAFHRFAALLPAAARDEMLQELGRELAGELRGIGSSPRELDRLLRAFGTQIDMALALEKGAVPKPELLVRIAVRDASVVTGVLQQLEGLATQHGLEWKTRATDDHTVRFCNVPVPGAGLQLSPCYVLTKDSLWLGSDAAALVRALRQDAADSLASQPDFQELAAHGKGASGLLHLRLFRAAEIGWRTVEAMGYPQLDAHRDEIGFGSEALPDGETIAKALGTSTFVYRVDDDGVTVQNRGTFSFGAFLAAFGTCGDELLGRASAKVY